MNTIVKGDDLMLFDESGHSIGLATSHTLTLSADAADINSKDHGMWGATEVNKINWEISSENLYSVGAFNELFDAMMGREAVTVYFGIKSQSMASGTTDSYDPKQCQGDVNGSGDGTSTSEDGGKYWTVSGTATDANMLTGKVFITSLTANAASGDNATFSVTLKGVGQLSRVDS